MNKIYLLLAVVLFAAATVAVASAASRSSASGKLIKIWVQANGSAAVTLPDGSLEAGDGGEPSFGGPDTLVLTANDLCDLSKPLTSGGAGVLFCIAK